MTDFADTARPLTSGELDEFERQTKIGLPKEFREFYLRNNGGSPNKEVFEDESGRCRLDSILSIKYGAIPGLATMEEAIFALKIKAHRLPGHLVPFGVGPFGDFFCFSTRDSDKGSIWLARMDGIIQPEERSEYLPSSLSAFLSQLV